MTNDNITPFENQLTQKMRALDSSPPPGMADRILRAASSTENLAPARPRGLRLQHRTVGLVAVMLVLATSMIGTAIAGNSILSPGLRDTMSTWLGIDSDSVDVGAMTAADTDQGVTVSASGVFNNGVLVAIAVDAHDPTAPDLVYQINVGLDEATGELAATSLRTEDGQVLRFAGLVTDPNDSSRMLVLYGTADGETIEADDFVLDIVGVKRYASNQLVDEVNGEWTLHLSVPQAEETQNLTALSPATVGPVNVAFGAFKYSDSFIGGTIQLSAPTAEDLAPAIPAEILGPIDAARETVAADAAEQAESDAAGQAEASDAGMQPDLSGERAPGIRVHLFTPDGEFVNPIYTSGFPIPGDGRSSADVVAFWPRGEAGTYRLVISYDGDAVMEWDLQVP